jgi:putative ABC transport system ATP-binding protein
MIRLEGVSLFGAGRVLLDNVHLHVAGGELVVIHGAGGSGKSLLLAVAAARRLPEQGTVWVAERSVRDLQRASLPLVHRSVAYLPAEPPFIEDEPVLENVMLALAVRGGDVGSSETGALRALATLGVEACAERRMDAIAGGERRLVALARALAGGPSLVVLDDPTRGLDGRERDRALAALAGARDRGAAVLTATSDEATVQALTARGARRVRLQDGRLHGGLPGVTLLPRPAEAIAALRLDRRGEPDLSGTDDAGGALTARAARGPSTRQGP